MPHQINGRSILRQVKSRIEIHRDNLKSDLSRIKIVIFQFNSSPDLTNSYEISKYKAADTSTSQKCKLFGDFLGCEVEVIKLPDNTGEMAVLLERFITKEFPGLKMEPWKLITLDKLAAELANRSPEDSTPINYLVDPRLEFEELLSKAAISKPKLPNSQRPQQSL
jgi:hypothetical protein